MSHTPSIKPMSFWTSILFFGIPALLATAAIYYGIPALDRVGFPLTINFLLFTAGPMILMFCAAFIAYRIEGWPFTWSEIKSRFRLKPIQGVEWRWLLGLVIVYIGGYFLLLPTAKWLASFPLFKPPPFLPAIVDPRVMESGIPSEMFGVQLEGQWWFLLLYIAVLFFNIFGEEFWWRGYILPRQELTFGKWTWLVHGLLWNFFHVFWKWNLIALLPSTLSLSFVVFKTKNSTLGIIVHWINNGLALIAIVLAILGYSS